MGIDRSITLYYAISQDKRVVYSGCPFSFVPSSAVADQFQYVLEELSQSGLALFAFWENVMNFDLLRDDCSRCAALCCVALAFDKSNLFAFDKPAGMPCCHIDQSAGCGIHTTRKQFGFAGCTGFSCHGAGQRVVQECFDGRDWRSEPNLLARMMRAFQTTRAVHDLIFLLNEAQKLPIAPTDQDKLKGYLRILSPDVRMTEVWLENIDLTDIKTQIHRFLQTLAPVARDLRLADDN